MEVFGLTNGDTGHDRSQGITNEDMEAKLMNMAARLRRHLAKVPEKDEDVLEGDGAVIHSYMTKAGTEASAAIPRFFHKTAGRNRSDMQDLFRSLARQTHLQQIHASLPSEVVLEDVVLEIEAAGEEGRIRTPEGIVDGEVIDFESYKVVSQIVEERHVSCAPFFSTILSPTSFAGLPAARTSATDAVAVPVAAVRELVFFEAGARQTRVDLSTYDGDGKGNLTEAELDAYLEDLFHQLPATTDLDQAFIPFLRCSALRGLLFFLDPHCTGHVSISDIVLSSHFRELLTADKGEGWFSTESAVSLYSQYLRADHDRDGLLSRREAGTLEEGQLSKPFLDRVFATAWTYGAKLDYRGYVDMCLALSFPKHEASARYLFKLFDVNCMGYIDRSGLRRFVRPVVNAAAISYVDGAPDIDSVLDELWDVLRPSHPMRICLHDIISSKASDVLAFLACSAGLFIAYDQRESTMGQMEEDSVMVDEPEPQGQPEGNRLLDLAAAFDSFSGGSGGRARESPI
ncbi:hypothetical protein KIPB_008218 [Kipferlia bialata]|uniref:EF-hand domain-containing protein n=1 Tax=Kipferlia bialata TaxID=797122 RepID=A0A9K3D0D6_9EUKA|nr:hypothetical protein KIPB_008218 [Kipferlia bialata]|eukprot:g8218.t1